MLGVSVRRPAEGKPSTRTTAALRRRLVVGGLVLLSLVLVTLSFREDGNGPVASAQSGAAAVLRPFQVAADRVAEPFRDAYGWSSSLLDARSDAARLEKENELLRQQVAERRLAQRENVTAAQAARLPQRARASRRATRGSPPRSSRGRRAPTRRRS